MYEDTPPWRSFLRLSLAEKHVALFVDGLTKEGEVSNVRARPYIVRFICEKEAARATSESAKHGIVAPHDENPSFSVWYGKKAGNLVISPIPQKAPGVSGEVEHTDSRHYFDVEPTLLLVSRSDGAYIFEECGHAGGVDFEILTWTGERRGYRVPILNIYRGVARKMPCPDCYFKRLQETAIRCCLCGGEILAGDSVALYPLYLPQVHPSATVTKEKKNVGCVRKGCIRKTDRALKHWTFAGVDYA